jgi:hypothetical protein
MAFAWRERLGPLLSLAGSPPDAAGFTCGGGLLMCTSCTEGYARFSTLGHPSALGAGDVALR